MSYSPLRIAKIIQETPDTRSYVLAVPAELTERFKLAPAARAIHHAYEAGLLERAGYPVAVVAGDVVSGAV